MQGQIFTVSLVCAIIFALDVYLAGGFAAAFKTRRAGTQKIIRLSYIAFSFLLMAGTVVCIFCNLPVGVRAGVMMIFFVSSIIKFTFLFFVFADDVRRFVISKKHKTAEAAPKAEIIEPNPNVIPRSKFLMQAGLLAGAVPLASLGIGMVSGTYDYRVRYQTLYLPNLPKSFDGIKLGQISDIHSGSFYNKVAVKGGVEMLMREKPDIIFFTGDLVNDIANEMRDYQDIFSKIKAPLGVFSVLGNHDYGDYSWWPTEAAKIKNHTDLITTHKNMGWDLLLNENRRIKINGDEIGILGCENCGELSRFPKYGRMEPTFKNTEDLPVKLLLSHDPSHWQAEIVPKYQQVDVMFSGHTHGMQFGVRTDYFQWSPVEYIYKEWAGLYREGNQQLYVNVGYGFLGIPGRIGILPEITIFTLKSAHDPLLKKA